MLRIAIIDRERCKAPEKCDYLCMKVCPVQKNNIKIFEIGSDGKPNILEEACIGCGLCVKKCSFNAIKIINLTKEPESRPVFQYGPNAFRLYRLPYPKENCVVGIIGKNGIGKSTAIKLLAGLLKPNLGYFDREISEREILTFFRGSELQKYFEKLFNGQIKLAYKPQDIFIFLKLYGERTVRELLEKVDKKDLVNNVIETFKLQSILDRKLKDLSGGELQKVAIALVSLKEANVYLYDEPTAFLDIYERLNSALYLDALKSENTSLVVIDHDLLFLDYLSDIVHIVYGVPKAYGVFSYPIGAREGINQYLEGFIKRENLRIRDKPIKLDIKSFEEKKSDDVCVSWKDFTIKLDGFELRAHEGEIKKYEIIGVIGRNGIGKSTFAKALAGVIKVNSLQNQVSISYKPQYLILDDELKYLRVKEFLRKINPTFKTEFQEYVSELGISEMLEIQLGDLSGGDLQTVMTFATLIQDKDLYVLDEPFAFLDVEQRVRMSKFIREIIKQNEKACLVVEHDLLFVDYISDKIIVFLGEPGKFGETHGPLENKDALNIFLKNIGITIRRDPDSKRPRINKPGSYLDRSQRSSGEFYVE